MHTLNSHNHESAIGLSIPARAALQALKHKDEAGISGPEPSIYNSGLLPSVRSRIHQSSWSACPAHFGRFPKCDQY